VAAAPAELSAEASQAQVRLQDAQQALDQAQPQLAALLNAQPAEQLRPLWTRQQEQSAALAQTHRQVEEVNTRLQDRLRLRAGIRLAASRQMTRLQDAHHALNLWLKEHDRYRQWGNSLAGWRAVFQQQARDAQQQNVVQQSLAETAASWRAAACDADAGCRPGHRQPGAARRRAPAAPAAFDAA
jgi:exonuclease SbcC